MRFSGIRAAVNPPAPPKRHRERAQTIKARITDVVDGDTIKFVPLERTKRKRYTVRLIGIDTPETKKPGTPVECGGREATSSAWDLSFDTVVDKNGDDLYDDARGQGRIVKLVTDPTQDTFDRYDRLLAYVDLRGGPTFAGAQLKRGWAKVYVYRKPFQLVGSFRQHLWPGKAGAAGSVGLCRGKFHRRVPRPIDRSPAPEYILRSRPSQRLRRPLRRALPAGPTTKELRCVVSHRVYFSSPPDLDCG